jgi:S-adenosylmethionine synthetase
MNDICLETLTSLPVERQRIELVEREGKGHPDSICDADEITSFECFSKARYTFFLQVK